MFIKYYKIKFPPYSDPFSNYLCYSKEKRFFTGGKFSAAVFSEDILNEEHLREYLNSKDYKLIEEPKNGEFSLKQYRGYY